MRLQIRFKGASRTIEVPDDATVLQLMEQTKMELDVAIDQQKFIFRGKQLDKQDEPLAGLGVTNNARLLLTIQEHESAPVSPPPRTNQSRAYYNQPQTEFLTIEPHKAIISKGPPPNCEKPYHSQMSVLPKVPFVVYNTEGVLSRLSFESDAVWIESDDGTKERIFFTDIRSNVVQEIPKYEKDYVALCLLTRYGKRWFYFIPNQYSQLLPKVIAVP